MHKTKSKPPSGGREVVRLHSPLLLHKQTKYIIFYCTVYVQCSGAAADVRDPNFCSMIIHALSRGGGGAARRVGAACTVRPSYLAMEPCSSSLVLRKREMRSLYFAWWICPLRVVFKRHTLGETFSRRNINRMLHPKRTYVRCCCPDAQKLNEQQSVKSKKVFKMLFCFGFASTLGISFRRCQANSTKC